MKAFVDVKRAQGRADLTILAYEQRLALLLADYLHRPVRSVTHRGAEIYAAALAGRRADSHQNLLVVGRLWGKWCVKQGWLRADPFSEVEAIGRRVHGRDKGRFTVDECRKLEAWCLANPTRQDAVLTLGYLYLGSRCSELARRDVRDLDDDGRLLWIRKTKTPSGNRTLAVPDALGAMLSAWCDGKPSDAPIFYNARGGRMDRNTARKLVRQACAAAEVPVMSPQALRRTWSSLATGANESPLAVARSLGHGSIKVAAQSYVDRDAAVAAQGERALRLIQRRPVVIGN